MSAATVRTPGKLLETRPLLILALLLGVLFSLLFLPNFRPGMAHFANDGPVGTLLARPYHLPDAYFGIWNDLIWLGAWNGNFNPNLVGLSLGVLGPLVYHKFMIPLGLIFFGMSAAFCFRRWRFPGWVCVVGGLAAALNMNAFSNACWGLPTRAHAMGAAFLAIAALHSSFGRLPWAKAILAGLAVGLGISEGGDNGALLAILVGCYGIFHAWIIPGPLAGRCAAGFMRVGLTAAVAAVFAAQTLNIFVNTAVKGVVGMSGAEDGMTAAQKWDFATQGSLPPAETLRVLIPGLFGYRMDAEAGGNYWGRVGESISAPGTSRHSGAGEYAGVLVAVVALWALFHSMQKEGGVYGADERKFIWFWGVAAVVCLLLAWGKWGPLYRFVYALPYFNTIRLPLKWMHPFHVCLLILFAYGLTGLGRGYLSRVPDPTRRVRPGLITLWERSNAVRRRWSWLSIGIVAVALLGMLAYAAAEKSLVLHLARAQVIGNPSEIASFSITDVYVFFVWLLVSLSAVLAIMSGRFSARSTHWVALGLGLILVGDMVRANRHWMLFFNYADRYAMNPLLQFLQDNTVEYRVARMPHRPVMLALQRAAQASQNDPVALQGLQQEAGLLQEILNYTHEQWQQNQFPYYNIPCLDVTQEPRLPADKRDFNNAMEASAANGSPARLYEMTSTRYFVGLTGQVAVLNGALDPLAQRFREGPRFSLQPTRPDSPFFGDLRVRAETNGPFAIVEFQGAGPRARLFTQWEEIPDDARAVARLGAADFDPARTVLVHEFASPPPVGTNAVPGRATITPPQSSLRVEVKVEAPSASILLLADRYDPAWRVTVDAQPATLLRCNHVMRGVAVPAGQHVVEFRYRPSTPGFWLMAGCLVAGLGLIVLVAVSGRRSAHVH